MKKIFVLVLSIVILCSCDPDVPGEGITLPEMEFAFKVSPDTAYMKVGDTLTLYAGISTTLDNGVRLEDGEGELWFGIGRGNNIPRQSENDIFTTLNNEDYHLMIEGGGVKWVSNNPNKIFRLTSSPTGDSIIMKYKFVLLKKGLYQIGSFQSSFYEGSKGKTRWSAYFDVLDPHWDLVDMPEYPSPQPGEYGYRENYLIAVTD